jgi:hypothetical protein
LAQEAAELRQNRGKCAVMMAQQPKLFGDAALAQQFGAQKSA